MACFSSNDRAAPCNTAHDRKFEPIQTAGEKSGLTRCSALTSNRTLLRQNIELDINHSIVKRFRILNFDFDARARFLAMEIRKDWADDVRAGHIETQANIRSGLMAEFGAIGSEEKVQNFVDLGAKPVSVLAFHNRFSHQARVAFVMGAYYPALTAVCALGERILNHLVLLLRSYYRSSPEYKRVYRRESIDDWNLAITTLVAWGVLLPDAEVAFRKLATIRDRSIHFNPVVDHNDRERALEAIHALDSAIDSQFTSFGDRRWFIPNTPGATYIRRDAESEPFVREVYLPNSVLVGPCHGLTMQGGGFVVHDEHTYSDAQISDEEFSRLLSGGDRRAEAGCD